MSRQNVRCRAACGDGTTHAALYGHIHRCVTPSCRERYLAPHVVAYHTCGCGYEWETVKLDRRWETPS